MRPESLEVWNCRSIGQVIRARRFDFRLEQARLAPIESKQGYLVLWFLAEDIGKELDMVLDAILRALSRRRATIPLVLHPGTRSFSSRNGT